MTCSVQFYVLPYVHNAVIYLINQSSDFQYSLLTIFQKNLVV